MTLVIQTTQFVSFPIIFEIISNVVLQFSGWDRLGELAKKILDPLKKISLEIYTTDFFFKQFFTQEILSSSSSPTTFLKAGNQKS